MNQLLYGGVPVPWTVSWSSEDRSFVDVCEYARGRAAICQSVSPGIGKPRFGRPHWNRQRQAIVEGRCDLCARRLKNRTQISLSHARPQVHAVKTGDILQVEPLLHKECALISMQHCPSLKRDLQQGTLSLLQVFSWRVQFAVSDPRFIHEYVPDYRGLPADRIIAHAKVQLLKWRARDLAWLEGSQSAGVAA